MQQNDSTGTGYNSVRLLNSILRIAENAIPYGVLRVFSPRREVDHPAAVGRGGGDRGLHRRRGVAAATRLAMQHADGQAIRDYVFMGAAKHDSTEATRLLPGMQGLGEADVASGGGHLDGLHREYLGVPGVRL